MVNASGFREAMSLLGGAVSVITTDGEERASWSVMESGSPLLDEALVNFDCRIVQTHEVGTHNIFYCEVLSVRTRTHQPEGLVYFNRKYHRVGDDSGAIC
ncbi:FMN reductase (NADH) RutF [compost metagenome]